MAQDSGSEQDRWSNSTYSGVAETASTMPSVRGTSRLITVHPSRRTGRRSLTRSVRGSAGGDSPTREGAARSEESSTGSFSAISRVPVAYQALTQRQRRARRRAAPSSPLLQPHSSTPRQPSYTSSIRHPLRSIFETSQSQTHPSAAEHSGSSVYGSVAPRSRRISRTSRTSHLRTAIMSEGARTVADLAAVRETQHDLDEVQGALPLPQATLDHNLTETKSLGRHGDAHKRTVMSRVKDLRVSNLVPSSLTRHFKKEKHGPSKEADRMHSHGTASESPRQGGLSKARTVADLRSRAARSRPHTSLVGAPSPAHDFRGIFPSPPAHVRYIDITSAQQQASMPDHGAFAERAVELLSPRVPQMPGQSRHVGTPVLVDTTPQSVQRTLQQPRSPDVFYTPAAHYESAQSPCNVQPSSQRSGTVHGLGIDRSSTSIRAPHDADPRINPMASLGGLGLNFQHYRVASNLATEQPATIQEEAPSEHGEPRLADLMEAALRVARRRHLRRSTSMPDFAQSTWQYAHSGPDVMPFASQLASSETPAHQYGESSTAMQSRTSLHPFEKYRISGNPFDGDEDEETDQAPATPQRSFQGPVQSPYQRPPAPTPSRQPARVPSYSSIAASSVYSRGTNSSRSYTARSAIPEGLFGGHVDDAQGLAASESGAQSEVPEAREHNDGGFGSSLREGSSPADTHATATERVPSVSMAGQSTQAEQPRRAIGARSNHHPFWFDPRLCPPPADRVVRAAPPGTPATIRSQGGTSSGWGSLRRLFKKSSKSLQTVRRDEGDASAPETPATSQHDPVPALPAATPAPTAQPSATLMAGASSSASSAMPSSAASRFPSPSNQSANDENAGASPIDKAEDAATGLDSPNANRRTLLGQTTAARIQRRTRMDTVTLESPLEDRKQAQVHGSHQHAAFVESNTRTLDRLEAEAAEVEARQQQINVERELLMRQVQDDAARAQQEDAWTRTQTTVETPLMPEGGYF